MFDTVEIKLVTTEYPKTSYKLSKTREKGKVSYNTSLYSDTKKIKNILNEKNIKIAKQEHGFKGYASTYTVDILNSFNPEL